MPTPTEPMEIGKKPQQMPTLTPHSCPMEPSAVNFSGSPTDQHAVKLPLKSTISRAGLAHLAGVSKAAITQLCRGSLAGARSGGPLDLSHPAVARYLDHHRVTQAARESAAAMELARLAVAPPPGFSLFLQALRVRVTVRTCSEEPDALDDAIAAFRRWAAAIPRS